ncbi:membrane protein, partial [Candidatus Magnetobacterium bavaricum]
MLFSTLIVAIELVVEIILINTSSLGHTILPWVSNTPLNVLNWKIGIAFRGIVLRPFGLLNVENTGVFIAIGAIVTFPYFFVNSWNTDLRRNLLSDKLLFNKFISVFLSISVF